MAISRFAAVVDAILAALRADGALTGVDIVDGPPLLNQAPVEAIFLGWNGDPDNDAAGSVSQNYHDLGPTATRDEVVEVYGVAQAARGDDDMATARSRVVTILGIAETALRANYGLGLTDVLRVEMSDSTVRQVRNGDGIGVEIGFTITATSLI